VAGTLQHQLVELPGVALRGEPRPVITVAGQRPGPVLLVTAGVHGCEYPGIETAIRLGKTLDPAQLSGTVVVIPTVNVPGFWSRAMFVTPPDGVNPNRVFPGDPNGSYSEQLAFAMMEEFITRADAFIDLHGGDLVEDLVPFSICRRSPAEVDQKALAMARVFGLPFILAVDRPIQPAKGTMTFVASAERGVPGIIAEAGAIGQLEEEPVQQLTDGIRRVLRHLGMAELDAPPPPEAMVLNDFVWLYSRHAGMFYPTVSINDLVEEGQVVGRIGSLFGETLEEITTPLAGRVLFLTTSPAMQAGGLLLGVGA
jgi:predicted deacylase